MIFFIHVHVSDLTENFDKNTNKTVYLRCELYDLSVCQRKFSQEKDAHNVKIIKMNDVNMFGFDRLF